MQVTKKAVMFYITHILMSLHYDKFQCDNLLFQKRFREGVS